MSRRPPRPLDPFTPEILTFNEKHGDRPFFCPTEAHKHAVALMIVAERAGPEYQWYYNPYDSPADREYDPKAPDMTLEAAKALPAGEVRDAALKQHKRWEAHLAVEQEAKDFWDDVQKALSDKDGARAWRCLAARADYEYEGFSIDGVEEIEPLPEPKAPEHGHVWVDPKDGARFVYDAEDVKDWIPHLYRDIRMDRQAHRGEQVTYPKR